MSNKHITEPKELEKAKTYLVKARFYRFVSICFAVIGVVIFLYLYLARAHGNVLVVLHSPILALVLLFPFIPAAFLSWLAARARKKSLRTLDAYEQARS